MSASSSRAAGLRASALRYGARTGEILGTDIRAALASKAPRVAPLPGRIAPLASPEEYHLHGGLFTTCEQHPPALRAARPRDHHIPGDRPARVGSRFSSLARRSSPCPATP